MELLSISSTLSPQLLPQTPSSSSASPSSLKYPKFLPKSPLSKPTVRISTPRNSFQIPQITRCSPQFDLGFGPIGLAPVMGSSASSPSWGAVSDVMGLLLKERIVFVGGDINDFGAEAIMHQLLLLDAQDQKKDIRLFINSSGGSLSATMVIFDVMKLVQADVCTVALGRAASTASLILGGGTKGKRFAMPNARIMFHQPVGHAGGDVSGVEIQAEDLMQNLNTVIRIISESTGRTFEQVEKDIEKEHYMSPIEAVEYGLIDGIIDRDSIIPFTPVLA